MSEFNGSFLGVRESSSATPEFVEEYAVRRANEKSVGADVAQFFIVFNSKNNSFGLAFSDELKESLGFAESYYYLVSGDSSTSGNTDNTNNQFPSDTLFPSESERDKWISDFNSDVNLVLNNGLSQLSNNKDLIESELSALFDTKENELIQAISDNLESAISDIKTAQTSAKSEITKHVNLKKTEIEGHVTAELERVSFDDNEKISALETEIGSLKQKISDLEDSSSDDNNSGLTIEDVREEIELSNSVNTDNSTSDYLTSAQINSLITTKLSEITSRLNSGNYDPSDPAMVDDTEILP